MEIFIHFFQFSIMNYIVVVSFLNLCFIDFVIPNEHDFFVSYVRALNSKDNSTQRHRIGEGVRRASDRSSGLEASCAV